MTTTPPVPPDKSRWLPYRAPRANIARWEDPGPSSVAHTLGVVAILACVVLAIWFVLGTLMFRNPWGQPRELSKPLGVSIALLVVCVCSTLAVLMTRGRGIAALGIALVPWATVIVVAVALLGGSSADPPKSSYLALLVATSVPSAFGFAIAHLVLRIRAWRTAALRRQASLDSVDRA